MRKLRFLEIRDDPHIVEWNDLEHRLARLDVLAYLHGAVRDDAVHWAYDIHIAQVEPGFIHLCLSPSNGGLCGIPVRNPHLRLEDPCMCIRKAGPGAINASP